MVSRWATIVYFDPTSGTSSRSRLMHRRSARAALMEHRLVVIAAAEPFSENEQALSHSPRHQGALMRNSCWRAIMILMKGHGTTHKFLFAARNESQPRCRLSVFVASHRWNLGSHQDLAALEYSLGAVVAVGPHLVDLNAGTPGIDHLAIANVNRHVMDRVVEEQEISRL
jgi:hypothetical protein